MSESVDPVNVSFRSGSGDCAATLYRAARTPHRRDGPGVVMCNGFSLTRRDGLPLFAEHFAAAGFTALTFDFRHLGDSSGEPRYLVDNRLQEADLAAAVAFARTIDGVDPDRVAAWGFSQGGGVVVEVAARCRLAAAVALFPMVDGLAFAMGGKPAVGVRLMVSALRDRLGRRSVRVPVVGPPGAVAVLNQPAARAGLDDVLASDSLWSNEVCAAPFLRAGLFRPVRVAHRVGCPLMVCLADHDTVVPRDPIVRVAARAPLGRLYRYPLDHFDAFGHRGFDRVLADQIAFLSGPE